MRQPLLNLQGERDYQVTMRDFAFWRAAPAYVAAEVVAQIATWIGEAVSEVTPRPLLPLL